MMKNADTEQLTLQLPPTNWKYKTLPGKVWPVKEAEEEAVVLCLGMRRTWELDWETVGERGEESEILWRRWGRHLHQQKDGWRRYVAIAYQEGIEGDVLETEDEEGSAGGEESGAECDEREDREEEEEEHVGEEDKTV